MNDLKDTKTADLIAEWGKNKSDIETFELRCKHTEGFTAYAMANGFFVGYTDAKTKNEAIATELDMRCVEAGISIVDGFPTFVCIIRESVVSRGIPFTTITVDVAAAELHALLGWLLLKEGGGNA